MQSALLLTPASQSIRARRVSRAYPPPRPRKRLDLSRQRAGTRTQAWTPAQGMEPHLRLSVQGATLRETITSTSSWQRHRQDFAAHLLPAAHDASLAISPASLHFLTATAARGLPRAVPSEGLAWKAGAALGQILAVPLSRWAGCFVSASSPGTET